MRVPEGPHRVDRYRLQGLLAAGGMGAVYRAYDEGLHRPVALKQILPSRAADSRARQRFRREARACAALSHPAIVQVFDVLAERSEGGETSDWIVMELVEGESLARRLEEGPLDLEEGLRLAREIAGGLAAAHDRGVVHRDLKAENVLVTREGHAKILDFGLAKRVEAEEPGLTESGSLLGTRRAMSPEQVEGRPVDHRSDLFSFGTLCYEMLLGTSPFLAATPFETLRRVTAHQPPRPSEVDPSLPEELSRLVDRLLEKDPNRRPQSAEEVLERLGTLGDPSAPGPVVAPGASTTVGGSFGDEGGETDPPSASGGSPGSGRRWVSAAAAAVLAVAAWGLWMALPAPLPELHVAVLAPRLETVGGEAEAERMALGLRTVLLRSLGRLDGVTALATEHVDPVDGPPRAVAEAVAADEVVTSRIRCGARQCSVSLDRLRGSDGGVLWPESFDLPSDDLSLLQTATEAWVRRAYRERRARSASGSSRPAEPVSAEAFARFLELRRRYLEGDGEDRFEGVTAGLRALRASTPGFLEAALLEGQVARLRFARSRGDGDLAAAFDALKEARNSFPERPEPLYELAQVALEAGQLERAEGYLDELYALAPEHPLVAAGRAELLTLEGDHRRALEILRRLVERRPAWYLLFNLANFEYAAGEHDAARRHLEDILESFPGHRRSRSFLAQLELAHGSPERSAQLYRELLGEAPGFTELSNLGLSYLLLEDYGRAVESLRQARDLKPENPAALLNLADGEWLRGDRDEARRLYRELLDLESPRTDGWQELSIRAQALAHLGEGKAALSALHDALRRAPDHPQAAYEAALVYVLVGEPTSALLQAERALEGGVQERWFSWPWFDPLRGDLERAIRSRSAAG